MILERNFNLLDSVKNILDSCPPMVLYFTAVVIVLFVVSLVVHIAFRVSSQRHPEDMHKIIAARNWGHFCMAMLVLLVFVVFVVVL